MERMTPEQAAALLTRIDDLGSKLALAEEQVKTNKKLAEKANALSKSTRRHTKWLWGMVGALVIGGIFVVSAVRTSNGAASDAEDAVDDVQASQVTNCLNANKTREGQRTAWRELLNVSAASLKAQSAQAGVEPPKAVLDYYAAYVEWIEEDVFRDRDCSDLDKSYPEPGPAPSFEEALKASLEDQG